MGEVHAAEDLKLKRRVALKLLPPRFADDDVLRERLRREAEAIAGLDHPNSLESISGEPGRPQTHFFTMQLIEGRPWRS